MALMFDKMGMPAEDPDKPKRPPTAFFVFLEDFRVQYKQKHPDNKSVAAVGKAGGEKWKSMSDAEKAPYVEEMEKRKAEYEKTMSAYKKKLELVPNAQMVVVHREPYSIPLDQPATELCFEIDGHQDRVKVSIQLQTSHHHQGTPSISAGLATDMDTHKGTVGMVRESETSERVAVKGAAKKRKRVKHPKKLERPPSAFFVFMENFRVQYKQKHPDNTSVAIVAKAGGEKWKSMSDAEKAPYVEEAEKRKADYEINMSAYKKRRAECSQDEREDELDKSRSEVNDEDDDDDSSEEDEDDE